MAGGGVRWRRATGGLTVDTIERIIGGFIATGLGVFTWAGIKGKADKALMDERHDTIGKALDKIDKKQDTMNSSLSDIKISLAAIGGTKEAGDG